MTPYQETGTRLCPPAPPALGCAAGSGTAFGTFGELLQGQLPERDGDFLVTLPVDRWSRAVFRADPDRTEPLVRPGHKTKALRLLRLIAGETGRPVCGELTLSSGIPEGKGLASSSADLVATARAVGRALGIAMPPSRIERFLARIEPTDGVLYPGIVAFRHRAVRLHSVLGSLPTMSVVGVDEGGAVDTVEYNSAPKPFRPSQRREYRRLLERLSGAVRSGDVREVGRIATRSALMNQALRYKWSLEPMREICREVGGLGVVVGHSGTAVGVLLENGGPDYGGRVAEAAQACTELAGNATIYRTLGFPDVQRPVCPAPPAGPVPGARAAGLR